jgi:hypothetical protein
MRKDTPEGRAAKAKKTNRKCDSLKARAAALADEDRVVRLKNYTPGQVRGELLHLLGLLDKWRGSLHHDDFDRLYDYKLPRKPRGGA